MLKKISVNLICCHLKQGMILNKLSGLACMDETIFVKCFVDLRIYQYNLSDYTNDYYDSKCPHFAFLTFFSRLQFCVSLW